MEITIGTRNVVVEYHDVEFATRWPDGEVIFADSEDSGQTAVLDAAALGVKAELVAREIFTTAWAEVAAP